VTGTARVPRPPTGDWTSGQESEARRDIRSDQRVENPIQGRHVRLYLVAVALLVVGCTRQTPYQVLVARFDACVQRSQAGTGCEVERTAMEKGRGELSRRWIERMCPVETPALVAAIKAEAEAAARLKQGPRSEELETSATQASARYALAQGAYDACVRAKVGSMIIEPTGLSAAELDAAFEAYFRAGQAERDAGLLD